LAAAARHIRWRAQRSGPDVGVVRIQRFAPWLAPVR
jgi:hypothetical protein